MNASQADAAFDVNNNSQRSSAGSNPKIPQPKFTPTNKPAPVVQTPAFDSVSAIAEGSVLLRCEQPVIVSNVQGPRRVTVGRPAEYQVTLENISQTTAHDLLATIQAPASAEIAEASASGGVVDRRGADSAAGGTSSSAAASAAGAIRWQLYELAPRSKQTLTLQVIPRSGRDMQLGVHWTQAPVGGDASIEVQEPKLKMEISGPAEVLFGKAQRYTLTLANPGSGMAEDVAIELLPPGGDAGSLVHHKVGTLAAGESKKIELELTAREAGQLKVQATATAAGDLRSEAVKAVLCRQPQLQVDWRGPDKQYAGAVATYFFRLRNPGTAPAEQVDVKLNLPVGAELVDASEGHALQANGRTIAWPAASLNPGDERFLQVRCRFTQGGVNQMKVSAQSADGSIADAKSAAVSVTALADIKLDIVDPKGAAPVGESVDYEIHIKNRGLTAARGVNVIAMFSEGIEPTGVDGAPHEIRDGRVTFRTIDNLAAGAEAVLRIHAKAAKAGTHVFRAEVVCEDIEAKLAAEETTRFFSEDSRWDDVSTAYSEEGAAVKR